MHTQFEFKNKNNKNIQERTFNLSKDKSFKLPDLDSLCATKWMAKYGYNAVFDTKFGRIVESK